MNNAIKGFLSAVGFHHLTIWKFISVIQKEQRLNEMKFEHVIAGTPLPPRKKYRDCAQHIQQIVENYGKIGLDRLFMWNSP